MTDNPQPLTDAQVAEIQRRCDAAKEFVGNCDGYGCVEDNVIACVIDSIPALLRDRAALVAEVERLRAELAQCKAARAAGGEQ